MSGSYAYVADGASGLQVINIANPASPYVVGTADTPGSANGVAVSGSYAYVVDGASGLQVINIANPASPYVVGSVNTPVFARNVAIQGNYAYVADDAGLEVVDITNPVGPQLLGDGGTDAAQAVSIVGDYVYVAADQAGLYVLPQQCGVTSGVAGHHDAPPGTFLTVYPNPASGAATIDFGARVAGPVQVGVFDIAGRRVRSLHAGNLTAGNHHLLWDGEDERGRAVPGGAYFIRLSTSERTSVARLVMLR